MPPVAASVPYYPEAGVRNLAQKQNEPIDLRPSGTSPLDKSLRVVDRCPPHTLINNTSEFRAQDEALLRSATLDLYHNVGVNWRIYMELSGVGTEPPTSRGGGRTLLSREPLRGFPEIHIRVRCPHGYDTI